MKKTALIFLVLLLSGMMLFGEDVLKEADDLFDAEAYTEGFALLEKALPSASSDAERAEINWRLARFQLNIADDLEDEGALEDTLLELFDKGAAFAEAAIAQKPTPDAYYWHSSNVGRWGETKGILNSLFKASPMRDDLREVIALDPNYADAWYVYGRLYLLLPGWPVSFGDEEAAASYARRSIDLYAEEDLKIAYYKSLAEILWKRDWDEKKRVREIGKMESKYKKEKDEEDKISYYEGALGENFTPEYMSKKLKDVSDHEEAQLIVDWLRAEYKKIPSPDRGEKSNMDEVEEMAAEW